MLLTVVNRWEAPSLSCATTHARWRLLQQRGLQNWRNIVTEKRRSKCSEFALRVVQSGPSSQAISSPGISESRLWTPLRQNPRAYLLPSHQNSWSGCRPSSGGPWTWTPLPATRPRPTPRRQAQRRLIPLVSYSSKHDWHVTEIWGRMQVATARRRRRCRWWRCPGAPHR